MRKLAAAGTLLLACTAALAQTPPPPIDETVPPASNDYVDGPDSQPHPGVPEGKTFKFEMSDSKVFPDTTRTITVYVPAQYQADKPACVYVGLDGLGFKVPVVFDNLIAQHAMPVAIAIGVSPGQVPSAEAPQNPRFDRSFEFDSVTGRLARFLTEEVLPAVEKHPAPDGKKILLSANPNDRAIGGGSTGAIGAFTVAFERPDAFRRVFSSIGTYVGMRGGERFYVLVRKTEPLPLRVFMQDGVHDEWPGGPEMGDWWMSNQTMERALEFAGYDVRHIWGAGTHNGKQAESVFPDAMRWLWRDWPAPLEAKEPGNQALKAILEPKETWQDAGQTCAQLAVNQDGEIKCQPPEAGQRIVRSNGDAYAITGNDLWLIRSTGEKIRLDQGLQGPSGIAVSPDGLWLFVSQSRSRWGLSYRVLADGKVDAKEPFYDFAVPGDADDSGASSVWMDHAGAAYVATRMGVQIFDRNGRVVGILPMPGNQPATSLCFGGKDFSTLYVVSGGKLYKRKLHSAGVPPWNPPMTLPKWGAG